MPLTSHQARIIYEPYLVSSGKSKLSSLFTMELLVLIYSFMEYFDTIRPLLLSEQLLTHIRLKIDPSFDPRPTNAVLVHRFDSKVLGVVEKRSWKLMKFRSIMSSSIKSQFLRHNINFFQHCARFPNPHSIFFNVSQHFSMPQSFFLAIGSYLMDVQIVEMKRKDVL